MSNELTFEPLPYVFYLAYSHFFRSKTCPNVTDLNCLISYEFFQKKKNAV